MFSKLGKPKQQPAQFPAGLVADAKPCPFCGQSHVVHTFIKPNQHYVGCFPCRAFIVTESRDKAIAIWNGRVLEGGE